MKFFSIFVIFVSLRCAHGGFWDLFSSSTDSEKEDEVAASEVQSVYSAPLAPAIPAPPPIWRVHRYHGIDLRPVGPIAQAPPHSGWPPEAVHLARVMGLEVHNLPAPAEVMNLLGVSTPEEALATIQDIAATPEGIAAMKSFLESRRPPPQPVYSLPALPPAPRLPQIRLPPIPQQIPQYVPQQIPQQHVQQQQYIQQPSDYFIPAAAESHPVTVLPPTPQRISPYESSGISIHTNKDIDKLQLALTEGHHVDAVSHLTSSGLSDKTKQ
ncbi:uncharacterized protein LOC129793746 [Lutzomyia longipalpis]|uniref:uncharacterized protein LOC129793746 n=1 Tax=Lutzomyia longipalpis TaxID=7200 RepID=UPI002483B361|nr:uncharacterized protein LOC129793746 [Lutzomyia longipalpis]